MRLEFFLREDGRDLAVRFTRVLGLETVCVRLGDERLAVEKSRNRHGMTYAFNAFGREYAVHSIVARGERYVSLYEDDVLVREYNYAAESAKRVYDRNPALYDKPMTFVPLALWVDAVIAGFLLAVALIVFRFADLLNSVGSVVALSAAVFVLGYAVAFGLHALLFFWRRSQTTKHGFTQPLRKERRTFRYKKK